MAVHTTIQLKADIITLGERLSLCSNSGEGRKVRKEIETLIKKKEKELALIASRENFYSM